MRRTLLTTGLLVVVLGGTACDSTVSTFGLDLGVGAPTCMPVAESDAFAQDVLTLVNQARTHVGSFPLTLDDSLSEFSAEWACTMIEDGFFAHDHPDGETFSERWDASDFGECYSGGENLAQSFATPDEVFEAWFNSDKGHREEILNDTYTHMGLAVRSDGRILVWAQHFRGSGCDVIAPQTEPDMITDSLRIAPPLPTTTPADDNVTPQSADPADDESEQ